MNEFIIISFWFDLEMGCCDQFQQSTELSIDKIRY